MTDLPQSEFELRIFPLPSLVFFPETRIPLHIFEPRYRQMVSDAIDSDGRIGMVLLAPGWETDYYGAPAVHRFGTVGIIEQVARLEDGRYNLLLAGKARFEILSEKEPAPYRVATVALRPETHPSPTDSWAQRAWLGDLARQYVDLLPGAVDVPEIETSNLETLVNALVMALNIEPPEKQELLEMNDLLLRCERIGKDLERRLESMQFLEPFRRGGDPDLN